MEEKNLESKLNESVQYVRATEHLMAEEKKTLEAMLRENLELTRTMARDMRKVKRFMMWRMIASWLWIFIVIAPIVLTIVYWPTITQTISDMSQGFFGGSDILKIFETLR